jgi:hypothetical protein
MARKGAARPWGTAGPLVFSGHPEFTSRTSHCRARLTNASHFIQFFLHDNYFFLGMAQLIAFKLIQLPWIFQREWSDRDRR